MTIPEDLLEDIREQAGERGISAYVTEAVRLKRDRDRLGELVDWLQEEYGPLTEEEEAATEQFLAEIDAEHERRRKAAGTGEAA